MEKEKIICLFLFVVLSLVFSSCHSRNISDIRTCHDERTSGLFVGANKPYHL